MSAPADRMGRLPVAATPDRSGSATAAGSPWRGAAIALLLVLAGGASAAGQEMGPGSAADRGWLGLGMQEVMECRWKTAGERRSCDRKLVIAQLSVGGPADRAGVEPGDTLLALNGTELSTLPPERRERLFGAVRPGERVRLRLGGEGSRRSVPVTAARRPASLAEVRWRGSGRVGALEVVRPAPAAVPAPSPADVPYVVRIQSDSGGVVQIRPAPSVVISESATVDVVPGVDMRWRFEAGPASDAARDSMLTRARIRVDSLRRWYDRRAPDAFVPDRDPEAGVALFERRLAGAEFQALHGELADYFQGVESGLLVLRVVPGTPAERLGLAPGDVVVEAGGKPIREVSQLRAIIAREGSGLHIRWIRKGRSMEGSFRED